MSAIASGAECQGENHSRPSKRAQPSLPTGGKVRAFKKGKPFNDVVASNHVPDDAALEGMLRDIHSSERHHMPVFSEGYLYPRLGVEDSRFVLGVADEYSRIISELGSEQVAEILRRTE